MKNIIDLNRDRLTSFQPEDDKITPSTITFSDTWGGYQEKIIALPQAYVSTISVNMKNKHDELHMKGSQPMGFVQLCMLLKGGAVFQLNEFALGDLQDQPNKFRMAFTQDEDYKAIYQNNVDVIHLSIRADYYSKLLSTEETWSAQLKEQILRQNSVFQKNTAISLPMLQSSLHLLKNPFAGTLQSIITEAKLMEIIGWHLLAYSRSESTPSFKMSQHDITAFHALKEHLDKTYLEEHSLTNLCTQFGLNSFKIKKGFKSLFSKTVFEYIIEKRLNHAYDLITDTDKPLTEICHLAGYKNQAHFSTAFKKQFNITPSSLRK